LRVVALDTQAIVHTYQVRGALDALAARLAAERRAALPPALLRDGRRTSRGRDVPAMIDADLAFHRALYAASGNAFIESSAEAHWFHIRRAMGAVLQRSTLRETVWDEHEAIAAAIGAGDADRAAELMASHDQRASDHISRQLAAGAEPNFPPQTATGDKR
ncbi:MAG: FCD domain-containing protein, partial [Rhizobacter sp.]